MSALELAGLIVLVLSWIGVVVWGLESTIGKSIREAELDLEYHARGLYGVCPHCRMAARPETRMMPDRSLVREHRCRQMRKTAKSTTEGVGK